MDRWQRLIGGLLLLLLIEKSTHFSKAEDNAAAPQGNQNEDQSERWSKPATAQRRQGDWIPVPCPGCQPIGDQSLPNRDRISSVLTPPARLQEPRLLPPPLPSESLYQQAATAGFLQTFQPPPFSNKGRQQQIPLQGGQFIQQPIQQPIHQNQQFNQQHHDNSQNQHNSQFLNQQQNLPVFQISPQAYTQQHAQLLNPSLINTQQQSIPPHFINGFISPIQQAPAQFQQVPINIAENQQGIPVPIVKPNFQNKPLSNQDSSTEDQNSNSKQQLLDHQRRPIDDEHSLEQKVQQQSYNNSSNIRQNSNEENEEVQLLYVPVEQLRQRGRNLGKLKQNNQFQTLSLPENVDHHTTNVPNNDNLNIPSSSGSSEIYQQNKQNNQFHEQTHFQYNQAALGNSQGFSQHKPEVQYKQAAQPTELGNNQEFPQRSANIQYTQQTYSGLTKETQEIPRGTPATQQLQPELPLNFGNSKEFNQNNGNAQYDDNGYTPSQEEIYRQQLLQKSNEKERQVEQSGIAEDLPQVTTSVYTTPSSKKHRFYKNKSNEPVNQLSQQQFIQETTQDILPKSRPQLLQSTSNSQNFNSELNNQQYTFETNNQRFQPGTNHHQFQQPDEPEFKTHSQQRIPSRQNEQIFQQQSRTANQEYIQQSSTIPPPHQPPLSVYMESGKNSKVSDVLNLLKNAKTIPVLDTVGSESPQVFVGPSNLDPPNGYIKFELPYLSSIENNRVERKVDKLPFFVAPLNFNPPPGYSKIPFPAPHIGSVVVSNVTILREALHEKPYIISPSPSPSPISSTPRTFSDPYTLPADISPISPQLPSLVNSLQDEIYSPHDTTEPSTPTTTTTTETYTTSSYRRTPSRGSHRGHSTYLTSTPTPTPRRISSRTRRPYNGRPYSHRQPVTTTTTTPLPTTEETHSRTQFTSQSEAQIFDTQPLFSQSNEQPTNFKKGHQQYVQNTQNVQQYDAQDNFETVEENNAPQRKTPSYDYSNQNIQQDTTNLKTQQIANHPKTEYDKDHTYHNYNVGIPTSTEFSTTTENIRSVPSFQGIRDENAFQSQRANNPRRENSLRNQRLRGRGHHRSQPTTTTEASLDSITTDSQDNPNTYQGIRGTENYNINENPFNYKNHKYNEQSDRAEIRTQSQQSNYKYPIQTERSDVIQNTATQNQYSVSNSNQYEEPFNQPTSDKTIQQNENFNIKNEYDQHSQFQQPNFQLNNNAQQQQIQSNAGASKHIHRSQPAHSLHSNQDYSVQSQQTNQPINKQNTVQENQPQNVQSFNSNQKYLVETHSPHDYSSHQGVQSAQNYNSQASPLINTKTNQQEYHDEAQPVQTKSIQTQNLEEQQYFVQFQPKEVQPLEPQTSTQQSYIAPIQPQQRQQQIPQQVSQQQYQNNNQNAQRYQHVQNPKFVQDYQVNFQSQAANIAQNEFPTTNHHIRPTEVTSQHEASVEQDNSQQTVSQVATTDDDQSIPVRSYNQQHLTKYTRSRSRNPINSQPEETYSDRTRYNTNSQDESQYQNSDAPVYSTVNSIPETTTQDQTTTTKSPLVRVRGRVRSRQRGQSRTHYTTTTEVPNYPVNVLKTEYSTEQSDEQLSSSQYNPQKRVNKNYKNRQPYESNQDVSNNEQTTSTNIFAQQSEPVSIAYSTTEAVADITDAPVSKPVRRYKHILNRNIQRRPSRPTQSPSSTSLPNSVSSGTAKYLVRTTRRPPTRLTGGRARIRKPTTTSTTTTTEYPQSVNPSWENNNAGNNFAPSAASNEVIDPYYSNQNPSRPVYNNYEEQIKPSIRTPVASVKTPAVKPSDSEEYWNQAVTIQQSTSYDFKPDTSPVTQASFQGTFEPDWDDQLSYKNENYYDNYRPQSADQSNQESSLDQAPFPSNEQQVIYTEIKNRPHLGKENQWNEKELLTHKSPGSSESKESFSLSGQIEEAHLKENLEALNKQSSHEKLQTGVNEGEVTASSENESSENVSYGLYPETSSKSEIFSDRITTSTEVDEALIRTGDEAKPNDPVTAKKPGRRRGSWVRVRVKKPQDLFETAESQNLATLSGNAIQPSTKPVKDKMTWQLQEVATVPTTELTSEPEETVDFEDALKNMLKDFITQPENESSKSNYTSEGNLQTTVNNTENVIKKSPEPGLTDTTDTTVHKETVMTTSGLETTTDPVPTPEMTTLVIPLEVGDHSQLTTDSALSTANAIVYETLPSRVIGTSTTTEISLETEICYRGRCVKTKTENESDLLTAE